MRPLLLALLCCLLTACTFVHAAPPPTPEPPSQEAAESLYRAFALQALTKDIFLEAIDRAKANNLPAGESIAVLLIMSTFLEKTKELLNIEYPAVLADDLKIAKAQYDTMIDINNRWFSTKELSREELVSELKAIAANENLRRYAERLVDLGFSHDDVEMMDARLKEPLKKVFASAE